MLPSVRARAVLCLQGEAGRPGHRAGRLEDQNAPLFQHLGQLCWSLSFPNLDLPPTHPQALCPGDLTFPGPQQTLSRWWGGGGGAQPSSSPALLSTTPARPSSPTNPAPPSLPVRTPDKPQALNMALPRVRIKNKIVQNGIIPVQMLKVSSISPCDWTEKCSIDLSTCTHALLSVCPCGRGLIRWGLTDMCSAHYIT